MLQIALPEAVRSRENTLSAPGRFNLRRPSHHCEHAWTRAGQLTLLQQPQYVILGTDTGLPLDVAS